MIKKNSAKMPRGYCSDLGSCYAKVLGSAPKLAAMGYTTRWLFWAEYLTFRGAVGWGVKLEDHVALRFDGLVVDQGGLVAPFVEGFGYGGD
jgi:hypothetical protein